MEYEDGLRAFEKLKEEINKYGKAKYDLTEADTRCKIIDKILLECLGWEEKDITRETHVHEGYRDYKLWADGRGLIVEAKKTSVAFNLPAGITYESKLSIGGLLRREKELKPHYEQVHNYCVESGVQFGCFTNGLHWIIFPATRDDGIDISKSKVIAFQGLAEIHTNFSAFWNLLSKESIEIGRIKKGLLPPDHDIAESFLINIDERRSELFHRNMLSDVFEPILPEYFGDLVGETAIEKLRNCYVESIEHEQEEPEISTLSKTIGTNPIVKQFMTLPETYDNLKRTIDAYHKRDEKSGIIYILLGRVGSGKSTFLYHFFNISNKEISDNNFVFFLNFNRYDEKEPLNEFFFSELRELSAQSELFDKVDYRFLEEAFEDDISALKKGPLGLIKSDDKKNEYIAEKMIEIQKDDEKYFRYIFNNFKQKHGINTVLVFDNVDQLDSKVQEEIVKFAYSKYQQWGSFIIISMREETYYKSKRRGSLSTIPCNIVHLPIQSIIPIITKRLEYFSNQLVNNPNNIKHDLREKSLTILDIQKYIELISKSLTSESDKVKNFLEAIALGNLRRSLEFFRTFLTAGNTDSGKIIEKMKTSGSYLVPDHEFIKSISLGTKRFYSQIDSPILNLFSISDMTHPSHFTKLRILNYLHIHKFQDGSFGPGFDPISHVFKTFRDIGYSEQDIGESIEILTEKGLIENDLYSMKYIDTAKAIKLTSTGKYYLKYISGRFAYLDLVLQETPFFDHDPFSYILHEIGSTDMKKRFMRVELFLNYLREQENKELKRIKSITEKQFLNFSFMPRIVSKFEEDREFIINKLKKWGKYP